MSEPVDVVVRAGDCPCPGSPHSEEHIYLEPELTMPMSAAGMAALGALQLADNATTSDIDAELTAAWLPRGIRSWTFLEEGDEDPATKHRPIRSVEINRPNLERLVPFDLGGYELIEEAGRLWMGRFMRPLVVRMSRLSALGQTGGSTSASPPSGSPHPAPSRPSLQNGGAGRRSAGRVP